MARRQHLTLRNLTEEGLVLVIEERESRETTKPKPITFKGKGLSAEFRGASWRELRDAAYQGRGS